MEVAWGPRPPAATTMLSNRVVGIRNDQIVDFDIQEALSMEKPYEYELHKIAEEIAI